MLITHAGDAHLGNKHCGLEPRLQDFRDAVAQVFRIAAASGSRAIIWPGDIWHSARPSHVDIAFMQRLVSEYRYDHGIESVGIDGNHDSCNGEWLEVVGITDLHSRVIEIDGVRFFGYRGTNAEVMLNELPQLLESVGNFDVFVTHQSYAELCGFSGAMLTCAWLASVLKPHGVKYVAMGDIHDYAEIEVDGIRMAYPGSTEINSRDLCRDRRVLQWDTNALFLTQVPLKVRRWHEFTIESEPELERLLELCDPAALNLVTVDRTLDDGVNRINRRLRQSSILGVADWKAVAILGTDGRAGVVASDVVHNRADNLGNLMGKVLKETDMLPERLKPVAAAFLAGRDPVAIVENYRKG